MTTDHRTNRSASAWLLGAALLGLVFGACKGGKTTDPAACMSACEQECPYVPDAADNEDYLECLEACQTKCTG